MRDAGVEMVVAETAEDMPESGLRARNLAFAAEGQVLIESLSLAVPDFGIHCLMGPNGAGKSLTLRLLHGLIRPVRGRITWQGGPVSATDRAAQAMVFQKPVLLRRSVAANVDFALKARRNADPGFRDALLGRVRLDRQARQPARLLSGGEQQRLALARALALRPRVLFLDEPTASLDPASALLIEDILHEERRRGTLCLLVTHDIGQARRLADSVAFMARGRITEHSPADTFFAAPASREARDYLNSRLVL